MGRRLPYDRCDGDNIIDERTTRRSFFGLYNDNATPMTTVAAVPFSKSNYRGPITGKRSNIYAFRVHVYDTIGSLEPSTFRADNATT